jgi:hypothetical protein
VKAKSYKNYSTHKSLDNGGSQNTPSHLGLGTWGVDNADGTIKHMREREQENICENISTIKIMVPASFTNWPWRLSKNTMANYLFA